MFANTTRNSLSRNSPARNSLSRTILAAVIVLATVPMACTVCADEPPAFESFDKIDCHVHFRYSGRELAELAKVMRFRVINISTNNFDIEWQARLARKQRLHFPGTVEHVTAFCMKGFAEPWWSLATIDQVDRSIDEDGAIGVKIWKDVGMHFRVPNGDFVLIDDDRFTPLLQHLEKRGVTLVLHMADPIEYWQPPESIDSVRRKIVQRGGVYVMYGREGVPTHAQIIAARDRVLARHPKLRIVGVHLGSLEHSLVEIAKRLDQYPNFAIDTAARMRDLLRHDRDELRSFILRYQDRIIYGTDMAIKPQHNGRRKSDELMARWSRDWNVLAGQKETDVKTLKGDGRYRGLALPKPVLEKIYRENALAWFPKIAAEKQQPGDQF